MARKKMEMARPKERLNFWWSGVRQELTPWQSAEKNTLKLLQKIESGIPQDIQDRLDYYVKQRTPFNYHGQTYLGSLSWGYRAMYYVDLMRIAKGFGKKFRLNVELNLAPQVPPIATIVRTRPIQGNVNNSILFPLNRFRHFYFPEDPVSWEDKNPAVAWRGRANGQEPRIELLKRYHNHPKHNIGHRVKSNPYPGYKEFMTAQEHMKYRYIPIFEGLVESTNIKWVMNSNSVAIGHPLNFEGWYMEGKLKADYHYIEVRRDLADMDEKLSWYNKHPEEARKIVNNANAWVKQFLDPEHEDLIATLVLLRYGKLAGSQLPKAIQPYLDLV